MNLRSLDLNLLVILDALLDEAHVSRAADRIGLSQPAASAALQRCRHIFDDALLERSGASMRLTAKAETIRAPLKALLADASALLAAGEIPLVDIKQTIRVSMADYPALILIAPLLRALGDTARGIDVIVLPWHGADAARTALVAGEADLAISVFPGIDDDLHRQLLLDERYVVAMRGDHPIASAFDLDGWLAYPHVIVSGRGDPRSPLDTVLAAHGRRRRVGVVVPTFQMVPELLQGTDMIAMLPSRCVPATSPALAVFEPPVPAEGFPLHIAWHKRRQGDRGLRHVAQIVSDILH